MGIPIFQSMAALVASAAKKLSFHHPTSHENPPAANLTKKNSLMPFLSNKHKKKMENRLRALDSESESEEHQMSDDVLWKRSIIMGEKCEPLDFSGVIYYDNEGKKLDRIPPKSPRNPTSGASPLPSFAFRPVVITNEDGRKKGHR